VPFTPLVDVRFDDLNGFHGVLEVLGERLRRWREEQGLTPYQLARRAGLSLRTVKRLEAGADIRVSRWLKAVQALGRKAEELFSSLELEPEEGKRAQRRPSGEVVVRILDRLRRSGGCFRGTAQEMAEQIGMSERQTWRGIRKLEEEGRILKRAQRGPGGYLILILKEAEEGRKAGR